MTSTSSLASMNQKQPVLYILRDFPGIRNLSGLNDLYSLNNLFSLISSKKLLSLMFSSPLAPKSPLNMSYLTDSYISFTPKLESWQNFCPNRLIRSSTYGKKNICDFPPCGKLVIFVTEFVIFLKTSK